MPVPGILWEKNNYYTQLVILIHVPTVIKIIRGVLCDKIGLTPQDALINEWIAGDQ